MGQQPRRATAPGRRSLTEWVILALLAEEPAHGFALGKQLAPDSDLGRILTVRRPLVYRAIDRLGGAGLVEPHQTESGGTGPKRTLHRPTAAGRRELEAWLRSPVIHVRDLRVEFLVKLRLLERRGQSAAPLIAAQREALDPTIDRLIRRPADESGADVVDLWRAHNARAVGGFLDDLQRG